MPRRSRVLQLVLVLAWVLPSSAEEWRRFRGPNGSGIADGAYPAELGPRKNVVWRTPVRPGKSSPVLTPRHVFLTSHDGRRLYTQCFDRGSGKLLWERAVDRPRDELVNALNHPAALTPATDGQNVYALFKDLGLVSYDAAGALRWKVPLGPFTNTMGLGASPIVAGGSVVVVADQLEGSYIAAFDRGTGALLWKTARDEADGWGTPLVYEGPGAALQILTASRGQLGAHRLADGKRTVTYRSIATTIVASPILVGDTLYVLGYGSDTPRPFSELLKKYDKDGDGRLGSEEYGTDAFVYSVGKYNGDRDGFVTRDEWDARQRDVLGLNSLTAVRLERDAASLRPQELWRHDGGYTGVIPSPLVYEGLLYVLKNGGILTAFDVETGKICKAGRVRDAVGGYSASPVAADGKLFLASEDGKLSVVRAGRDWDLISSHDLAEACYATPALSGGRVYLRSSEALYCFGVAE